MAYRSGDEPKRCQTMIDGKLAPIFDSRIAGPDKVRISGDGSSVRSEPTQKPLVTGRPVGEVAEMSAVDRLSYIRETGQAVMQRQLGKVVDILT